MTKLFGRYSGWGVIAFDGKYEWGVIIVYMNFKECQLSCECDLLAIVDKIRLFGNC